MSPPSPFPLSHLPLFHLPFFHLPLFHLPLFHLPLFHLPLFHLPLFPLPLFHLPLFHLPLFHLPLFHLPLFHLPLFHLPFSPFPFPPPSVLNHTLITPSLTRYHLLLCLPLSLLFPHPPHAIHASTLHAPPLKLLCQHFSLPQQHPCIHMPLHDHYLSPFQNLQLCQFPLPNITSPHHDFLPQISRSQHFFSTQFILRQCFPPPLPTFHLPHPHFPSQNS